jgi:hypothetical protein
VFLTKKTELIERYKKKERKENLPRYPKNLTLA